MAMEIRGLPSGDDGALRAAAVGSGGAAGPKFADVLGQLLTDVNKMQTEADEAAKGLLTGSSDDLHRVMLALNRADLSMRFLVEVRNRALEAYNEISKLPV
jgi:flagellar hook-basal body complex protein FliE